MKSSDDSKRGGNALSPMAFFRAGIVKGQADDRFKLVALKQVQASKEHLEKHCMPYLSRKGN